jgi:hypothetical protein
MIGVILILFMREGEGRFGKGICHFGSGVIGGCIAYLFPVGNCD